jgi:cytochrome P450
MSVSADTGLLRPPDLDIDPFSPEHRKAPSKLHELLRETAAVVRIPRYDFYAVARHDEVETVLKDYSLFSNTGGSGLADVRKPGSWREPAAITSSDPPEHTPLRKTMNRIISPIVVRSWREAFEREGRALVSKLVAKGSFDVVKELSEPFVVKVFTEALGVQMTREQAVTLGDYNFNALGPKNELFQKSEAEIEPLKEWLALSRTRAGVVPGGWASQIFDSEAAGDLPAGSASSIMLALLRGGMDTTISGIGSCFALLAQHKDQWARFRANPALAKAVFEETIRLEAPIQSYFRTTLSDGELSGYRLERDKKIQIYPAAANRDPRKWEDPEAFDITRSTIGHLALGAGAHNCVGQMIARLEGESVLAPFVELVSDLELESPPVYRANNTLRTLQSLRIRVTPA